MLRITEGSPDHVGEFLAALGGCFLAVYDYPDPVVAAISGAAIAGRADIAGQ